MPLGIANKNSCQSLAALQNLDPAATVNHVHNPLQEVCFIEMISQVNTDFAFQVISYNFICCILALEQNLSYFYIKKKNPGFVSFKFKKISPLHLRFLIYYELR